MSSLLGCPQALGFCQDGRERWQNIWGFFEWGRVFVFIVQMSVLCK